MSAHVWQLEQERDSWKHRAERAEKELERQRQFNSLAFQVAYYSSELQKAAVALAEWKP